MKDADLWSISLVRKWPQWRNRDEWVTGGNFSLHLIEPLWLSIVGVAVVLFHGGLPFLQL